ncbi:MAG: hypothetical protein Q9225_005523 [Loekoesia sp. 1 TL-2023]
MGKLTDSSLKETTAGASSAADSDSYDSDEATLAPSTSETKTPAYHIWNSPQASLKITKPDMTPVYTKMTLYATLVSHSSSSKSESWIEIRMDARHSPSSEYTIKFHRDGGFLKRRHRMTLSNGKTYVLRGKHSTNLMMCWGNLKLVEEGSKTSIADFKVEWPSSFHKFGTVTFKSEVEDTLAREILFAFIGVANKEYAKAMAAMMVAVPGATC